MVRHPDEPGWAAIREYLAQKSCNTRANAERLSVDSAYTPLDHDETRILELKPADFDEPLEGSLHIVKIDFAYPTVDRFQRTTNHAISLAEAGPFWYTALSYTWGAPIFNDQFCLENNIILQITSSLASALKHLRSKTDSVFLWIDQICINQADILEKQHQIPLMGMIYSHATNTVIWLGDEGDDNPQLAFDTLQMVFSKLQWFQGDISPEDFERLAFPALAAPEWAEVNKLFCRSWFERLWTIQEAVLSKDLYVKCGKAVVGWEDFSLWASTMESSGLRAEMDWIAPSSDVQTGLYTLCELSSFRALSQRHVAPAQLLETLVLTRYAKASVAKDKVYGVLGIATAHSAASTPGLIKPRYSEDVSVRDVFLEAGLAELPTELFRLLSCVDHEQTVTPSWIPDWTVPRATESLGYSTRSWTTYSACSPTMDFANGKAFEISYTLEDDNRSLVLPGMVVDTIAILGEPQIEEPFVITGDQHIRGDPIWLKSVSMAKETASYPTEETVWDAFWNTLAAGKDGSFQGRAPQDYSEILSLIIDECIGEEQHIAGQPYTPRRQKGFFTVNSLASRKPKHTLDDMKKSFRSALHRRAFAITKKGFFCLAPRLARVDDAIVIFQGGHVPFVVRSQSDGEKGKCFELIGETYVRGIMRGEAFDTSRVGLESIKLV